MLFRHIVFYALLVGVVGGVVYTAVQLWQVIPIIQQAERFEGGGTAGAAAHATGDHAHEHDEGAWAPAEGVERTAFTLLANVLTAIGLALVLIVAIVATARVRNGSRLDWRYGLLWGAAGYVVFFVSPSLGLPPEIPGAAAAPLVERQLWWLVAVALTAAGLAGAAFGKSPWRWAFLGLLAVPHLMGVPQHPGEMFPGQPPEAAAQLETLAREFLGATALANAVLWLVLGLTSVWVARRIHSTQT